SSATAAKPTLGRNRSTRQVTSSATRAGSGMRMCLRSPQDVFPAKAGTHRATAGATDRWVPACAGMTEHRDSTPIESMDRGPGSGSLRWCQTGRDGLRQQQVIAAAGVHRAGAVGGFLAVAPEQIAAHRPLDGAAGVLGDDEAADGLGLEAL